MEGHALLAGTPQLATKHYKHVPHNFVLTCIDSNYKCLKTMIGQTNAYKSVTELGVQGKGTAWSDVLKTIRDFQRISKTQPCFFSIYLIGHGAMVEVDGASDRWVFLCFEDQMVSEYELRKELAEIDSKSHIYLVIESCSSSEHGVVQENFFQNVYDRNKGRNQVYYDLYNRYRDVPNHYPNNICLLASSKKMQLIPYKPGEVTDFMNLFLQCWNNSLHLNYFTFFNLLQSAFVAKYKPQQWPEKPVNNGTFDKYPPFFFPGQSVQRNATPVGLSISVEEHPSPDDKTVTVTMVNPPVNYYYTDSITMSDDMNGDEDFYIDLRRRIIDIDPDALDNVEVIGIVYVNTHGMTGTLFPSSTPPRGKIINYMESVGIGKEYPVNGLVVVLVTNMSNGIIAHKRTKGKVSNAIGGR